MSLPKPASSSARFLDESVLPVFTDLRMTAFGQSVIDIAADPAFDDWSFSDKVLYALDKEVAAKRERRVGSSDCYIWNSILVLIETLVAGITVG